MRTLIRLVGEQTRALFGADLAYVALLDRASEMIDFPYTYGEDITPLPYGEGLTSKILQTNQPLLINQDVNRQASGMGETVVGQRVGVVPRRAHRRERGGRRACSACRSTVREGMFSQTTHGC